MKTLITLSLISVLCIRLASCQVKGDSASSIDTPKITTSDAKSIEVLSTSTGQSTLQPTKDPPTAEIHASFSDDVKTGSVDLNIDQSVLSKIHIPAELSETVQELVLTLAEHAVESEVMNNASDDRYVVRAQPKVPGQQPPAEELVTEPSVENITDTSTKPPLPPADDIPSFSEWTQQQLAERRRADPNVTERVRSTKVRIKNYASPDCGAKIIAANPEAVSAGSILSSSRDEYMLNHCTSRIWFIVELCEAVQAKQLDLANFELFSSSPKEFSVLLGSRFPSRDWQIVGRFTAEDSRNIQTFDLNPQLFGKFLKVEVHSHYGKEHYCPLSWVRVYGTSEYEVLATEDERHTDDDDDMAEEEAGAAPRNLFTSATDAVLSIVKKATAPFLKAEHPPETAPAAPSHCFSPRYLTVCDNCSQHTYDNLFYTLSCLQDSVYKLVNSRFIRETLIKTDTCLRFGLDFVGLREGAPFPLPQPPEVDNYITALLKEPIVAALCNALAVLENRVVVNTSAEATPPRNSTDDSSNPDASHPSLSLLPSSSTCVAPDYSTSAQNSAPKDYILSIKPTKTLREEDVKNLPDQAEKAVPIEHTITNTDGLPSSTPSKVSPSAVVSSHSKKAQTQNAEETGEKTPGIRVDEPREKEVPTDSTLDSILQDLSELEQVVYQRQPTSATPPPSPPKDSIFLRLANRIKNLELNMSLSSSYLEELSRRYRQQQETLGQTVNSTAFRLDEFLKIDEVRSRRRDEEMTALKTQVAILTKEITILLQERNSWFPKVSQLFWFSLELLIIWYMLKKWSQQHPAVQHRIDTARGTQKTRPKRRNSVEAIPGHVVPERSLERRPSDEALEITILNSYSAVERKRKKRKKESSRKSSAVSIKRKKSEQSNSSEDKNKEVPIIMRQYSEPPLVVTESGDDVPVFAPDFTTINRFAAFESPRSNCQTNPKEVESRAQLVRRFSSPAFMRTAISSRAARSSTESVQLEPSPRAKKESGFKKYMRKLF